MSLFGTTTIEGNRLTDMPQQTCAVGIPIPFVYGASPVDGNLIWAGEIHEHVSKKKQGKGGGVETRDYSYTISYAIGVCLGPIFGYLTIERNGKVVYTTDPNATVEDEAYAAKWLQKATLYYGTRTQMPSSIIEAQEGAGNVSAFRGLAYFTVEEDDVTDNGGAIPSYRIIPIANSVAYLTTPPYTIETVESIGIESGLTAGEMNDLLESGYLTDRMSVQASMTTGQMRTLRKDALAPNELLAISATMSDGQMRALRKDALAPNELLAISATMSDGQMKTARIDAQTLEEKLQIAATMVGGSMHVP